uniref:G_PROTEIN_RECEP_F1_2 domain-containing protein n=1 Tax=Syphacia muris TaxID=451379 RepID=A0A158R4K6_9BILA
MEAENSETFETTADGQLKKPSRLNSDYIDSVVLLLVLLIGVPLNVIALIRLWKQYMASKVGSRGADETRSCYLMLKIQLTVVDLILLISYIPPKLLWLYYYEWPFGTVACKGVVYLWMFSHHLMSFAIMIIAIDRAKTVWDLMKMKIKGRMPSAKVKIKCIKMMITLSYIMAALFSLPQWFVWSSYMFGNWSQCTTMWQAAKARDFTEKKEDWKYFFQWETIYSIVHLFSMFWIPFLIVIISYACIMVSLCYYSSASSNGVVTTQTTQDCDERTQILMENGTKIDESATDGEKSHGKIRIIPTWQTTMRSRLCHTSAQVILAYLVCWLPYNLMQISGYISTELGIFLSVRFDSIFKLFVLFNTLFNPFIYGFNINLCCSRIRTKKSGKLLCCCSQKV